MPQATFLVTVEVDEINLESLAYEAASIQDELSASHTILSVTPWQRPSFGQPDQSALDGL